jgi:hypothetical protein
MPKTANRALVHQSQGVGYHDKSLHGIEVVIEVSQNDSFREKGSLPYTFVLNMSQE